MPIISVSKRDFERSQPIPEGVYDAEIIAFTVGKPKSGADSMNYMPVFRIEIPGKHKEDYPEIKHTFNSAAPGFMTPFIAAKEGKTAKEIADDLGPGEAYSLDTDAYIRVRMKVKIKNELYDGRLVNKIDAFYNINDEIPF